MRQLMQKKIAFITLLQYIYIDTSRKSTSYKRKNLSVIFED